MIGATIDSVNVIGKLKIRNWQNPDPDKYHYVSVRVVNGELWYYGADSTLDHARHVIEGYDNAFIIDIKELI